MGIFTIYDIDIKKVQLILSKNNKHLTKQGINISTTVHAMIKSFLPAQVGESADNNLTISKIGK